MHNKNILIDILEAENITNKNETTRINKINLDKFQELFKMVTKSLLYVRKNGFDVNKNEIIVTLKMVKIVKVLKGKHIKRM
jgi:hypothetical protein